MILGGDFLGAEVFFDGEGIVAAALYCGVIGGDDAQPPFDLADAGDETGGGDIFAIDIVRRQLADFQESCVRIEQRFDAVTGEQLAARCVPGAGGFRAAFGDAGDEAVQIFNKGGHVARIGSAGGGEGLADAGHDMAMACLADLLKLATSG